MARHRACRNTYSALALSLKGILEAVGTQLTAGTGEGGGMSEHVVNDLDKLKGIGPKYKEMLKSIGVDSIKELRHRNPAHLKEMIEERHGPVVGLSENETQTWIDEAKAYQE
jgi:predicted flap endonuclease-1-like 5' DNA nuclease